jgi:NAD dependent epimerase/dehydratase family enzyme
MSGPINAVAPDVRRQRDLAREMGRVLHRPAVIPAPAPLLRLALGQESELLLHGRRAAPAKAQAAGYAFQFGGLPEALENLLGPR